MLSPLRSRFGHRLREPFGKAGLSVAVIALVFAMLGGAYAASDNGGSGSDKASASAKAKQGPRGPRGKTGPAGPAGPAGPQGPAGVAGAKGDKGDAGSPGAPGAPGAAGANGKTILSGASVPSTQGTIGDYYLRIAGGLTSIYGPKSEAGWGSATLLIGPPGAPWPAGGTLPAKATQTGTFSVTHEGGPPPYFGIGTLTNIDFFIPLAAALDENHVKMVTGTVPAECENTEPGHSGTASAENPEADPGYLCAYLGESSGMTVSPGETIFEPDNITLGAGVSGALVLFLAEEEAPGEYASGFAVGTWAVTGAIAP